MKPIDQSKAMISWFFDHDVCGLDVHLRVPKVALPDYNNQDDWFWITEHENLDQDKVMSLLDFCKHKNVNGSDVFIRPHRNEVHPILFLDDLDLKKSKLVAKKYSSLVIETSKGNHQVWLVASNRLDKGQRMASQRLLSSLEYSDSGSISGDHLGRFCGFKSHKRNCWVNFVDRSTSSLYDAFQNTGADLFDKHLYPPGGARVSRKRKLKVSEIFPRF